VNVYDFDHTIYCGDCTIDFWKHCARRYPAVLLTVPKVMFLGVMFRFKRIEREYFKECFYQFLRCVPDVEAEVLAFWDRNEKKVSDWYIKRKQTDDVIISASPEFLICEICRRLEVNPIASKVCTESGRLEGPNCRGEEKVRRILEQYPDLEIENFYSDSLSDGPLAIRAKTAYMVKKRQITYWPVP